MQQLKPFVAFPRSTEPSWLVRSVNQIFCLTQVVSGHNPGAGAVSGYNVWACPHARDQEKGYLESSTDLYLQ